MLGRPSGRVRWSMAGLLGVGVLVNYFDRVNLSVTAKPLQDAFHLTAGQYGILLSAFLWSYAILQIPVGSLLDRVGVTWIQRVGTILWTVTTLLTAVASGLGLLIVIRVLLGIAEAPAFPAAGKSTGQWFPRHERGLATAAFDAAAKFSNVIGVPLVALVVTLWGWQAAFVFTGAVSGVYAVAFWILYRSPEAARREHRLSEAEHDYIVAGGGRTEGERSQGGQLAQLRYLIGRRQVWGLMIGFSASGYAFFLFLSWLPGYLQTSLGMPVLKSGLYTAIPWVVATCTDLFVGGWLIDRLARRGYDQSRVRKTVLSVGLVLGLAVIGAAFTRDANVATALIAVSLGGVAMVGPVSWSIPALLAPEHGVGALGSIMNCCGQLMSLVAPVVTGFLVDATGSFASSFVLSAVLIGIGVPCFLLLMGPIQQLPSREEARRGDAVPV